MISTVVVVEAMVTKVQEVEEARAGALTPDLEELSLGMAIVKGGRQR